MPGDWSMVMGTVSTLWRQNSSGDYYPVIITPVLHTVWTVHIKSFVSHTYVGLDGVVHYYS